MSNPTETMEDTLRQTERLARILRSALPLTPIDIPETAMRCDAAGGWEDLHVYTAPKIERIAIHRFFIQGRLREHLCLAWTGDDYDLPALGLDIYEHADTFTLVADFIPMADVGLTPGYYRRYIDPFKAVLDEWWPRLAAHRVDAAAPPSSSFSAQLGSCLAQHLTLNYAGLPDACAFQTDVARAWVEVWRTAQPLPERDRAAHNRRRDRLIRQAFKQADYESFASVAMARVVGKEVTDQIFDAIFG